MGNQMHKNLSNLLEQKVTSGTEAGVKHQLWTLKVQVFNILWATAGFLTISQSVRSQHFLLTTDPFCHQDKC